jgi:oligogalacturonide lyase
MQKMNCRLIASRGFSVENLYVNGLYAVIAICLLLASPAVFMGQTPSDDQSSEKTIIPSSWTDADNGYQVIRLTNDPGSKALDSPRSAFTPDGKDMIYRTKNGIGVLNLATLKTRIIARGSIESLAVGTRTRRVFFTRGANIKLDTVDILYAVNIDTGVTTKLANLPLRANVMSVNSDETLLVGDNIEGDGTSYQSFHQQASTEVKKEQEADPNVKITGDDLKERAMKMRAAANVPEDLFTVDLQTGKVNTILSATDWIGYAQFSPTDPALIMYTHEGMYYESDRIWTIRSDGSQNQLIHQRTNKEESATREFWSQDGKTIWYEWQKPRDKEFAMVGYDVATGKRRLFKMDKDEVSISYNVAAGDAFFVGSGRHSGGVHRASSAQEGAARNNKQSIEILYPVLVDKKIEADPEYHSLFNFDNEMAHTYSDAKYVGWFRRVTIANMLKNDYTKLEPNIRISPDNKYVIFTSNILGPTYIFAVELN